MQSFKPPVRKDRAMDYHGGILVYVKESVHYKRHDLTPVNVEFIWIDIQLNHTSLLFGLFYRPLMFCISVFEDSISLAMDTKINNIIVTGDFNFNMFSHQSSRKITDICVQFSLH